MGRMDDLMNAALTCFLANAARAQAVTITDTRLLSGGTIQENWLVRADVRGGAHQGELDVVVRTDSLSGVSLSHNRAQEFSLLTQAFRAGVTVPEPLWLCEDPRLIGRQFFVMRRIGGAAHGHVVVKDLRLGGDRRLLTQRLGTELARIHSIRPPCGALDFLPWYDDAPAQQSIRRLRAYLDTLTITHPPLEWGLRWLQRHAPPRGEIVLSHRDFRTGNYMVDENGLTGILDWEFAGWSDPLEDLGWFLAKCWRFGANQREAGGIGEREDFYRAYEAGAGRPIARDQVRYWEVMAHMNWAMIALQQAERHVSGEERSLLLALTGHVVPELEYEIMLTTGQD